MMKRVIVVTVSVGLLAGLAIVQNASSQSASAPAPKTRPIPLMATTMPRTTQGVSEDCAVVSRQQQYIKKSMALDVKAPRNDETFLSRLAGGDAATAEPWMAVRIAECNRHEDCTDFRLNVLMRALLLYGDRLSGPIKDSIRQTALAGRYYGGFNAKYPMYYSSENHHMAWAVAEYLAAQAYPDAVFTYDGRPARQHRDRARYIICNWIDRRARWGYCEWNSSCYMGINLMSLLNLVDLSDEPEVRRLARDATTKLLADLAADSAYGGVWAAQARLYYPQMFRRSSQGTAIALAILLGAGTMDDLGMSSAGGDIAATTSYRPPQWLVRLANDLDKPMVNLEHHRSEGGRLYQDRSVFWRPPVEISNPDKAALFTPADLHEVAIRTERCKQYIVSAAMFPATEPLVQGMGQSTIWIGCLRGDISILTTHPAAVDDDHAIGYWIGTGSVPRCYLQDGVLAAVYHSGKDAKNLADFTHAHFPTTKFDQWQQQGRWFMGAYKDAYVGLLAPQGGELTTQGQWAGMEIKAPGTTVAWVAVFGSEEADGSFDNFMARCAKAAVTFDEPSATVAVQADSTANSRPKGQVRFSVSHAAGTVIDGKPFAFDAVKQMDNPVVQADWASPIMRINTGAGQETIDFSRAREIAKQWERDE